MPTTKTILSLIIFFAICNSSRAFPDNSNFDDHDVNAFEKDHPTLTPKQHLFAFAFDGFANLTLFYVNRAANISEHILRDATLNKASDNIIIRDFKRNLTVFLNKYQTNKEFEDLFELVELYSNTTSDYFQKTKDELTEEGSMIVDVLSKYGSQELDKKFEKLYDEFVQEFSAEFEKVKIYLEKRMLNWFDQFKLITDMNERTVAFEKFIMFYL